MTNIELKPTNFEKERHKHHGFPQFFGNRTIILRTSSRTSYVCRLMTGPPAPPIYPACRSLLYRTGEGARSDERHVHGAAHRASYHSFGNLRERATRRRSHDRETTWGPTHTPCASQRLEAGVIAGRLKGVLAYGGHLFILICGCSASSSPIPAPCASGIWTGGRRTRPLCA